MVYCEECAKKLWRTGGDFLIIKPVTVDADVECENPDCTNTIKAGETGYEVVK